MNDLITIPRKTSPPVCVLREGGVTVCLWQNGKYLNATIDRMFEDKNTGASRSAKSMNLRDLSDLRKILPRAIVEMEKRAITIIKAGE